MIFFQCQSSIIAQTNTLIKFNYIQTEEELEYLLPMVDRKQGIFSPQNNDSDILMNQIFLKDFVYIRDKPAIDHLVSF